ncbi:hypothetical protein [Pseudarthrobacter sp. PS3-L1]|uniref:hypothetical protein n=1 Tax=Pseudarthrobacter sp. PS3-L1 TaxID=3046207 RepID=UPI0024BAAC94|nr:hypothetical protein [Pseudarthrobacter sp. PS3-L1]MDJ0321975.1 hypothetical protein [Pseudarthrobacter sp. PS3-L1]
MSETDGMDEFLDGGMRQTLMMASRIAETIARRRQESARQQEHQDAQAAHEAQAQLAAQRTAAQAALAPVEKDQWWDKAGPHDIATAHTIAESWKENDPMALATSEKIREEVLTRYGIDTHDVGNDSEYLASGIEARTTEKTRQDALALSDQEKRKAAAEHDKAMALLGAARAEDLRAQTEKFAPEMERNGVPAEYLANPDMVTALERAQSAKTPKALAAADATVQERKYLIGKDGINGPDIDQLRKETEQNVGSADALHFNDADFVHAAKNMHEAKILAEGGFKGNEFSSMEQRYERAEKELFARMEGVGREIENRVTGNDNARLKDQGLKTETESAASYGSAEHNEQFAESLKDSGATEAQIHGRVIAARSQGAHPAEAVALGKNAKKARKSSTGKSVGAERAQSGRSR